MLTDPIADILTRIQNAGRRGHDALTVPGSRLKSELLRVLKAEGFIEDFGRSSDDEGHDILTVRLRYLEDQVPMITGMRRVSRPGRRVYVGRREIRPVRAGLGLAILSTSKGVMTDMESRRAGLGGEVLCHVW